MSESNTANFISRQTSTRGEVTLNWGSSEPRRHHVQVSSSPSSRAVRAVLLVSGEEVMSRRVGLVFHYLHEAPGGTSTAYTVRALDDNDLVVPEEVSIELRDSAEYPAWESRS